MAVKSKVINLVTVEKDKKDPGFTKEFTSKLKKA